MQLATRPNFFGVEQAVENADPMSQIFALRLLQIFTGGVGQTNPSLRFSLHFTHYALQSPLEMSSCFSKILRDLFIWQKALYQVLEDQGTTNGRRVRLKIKKLKVLDI